MAFIVSTIALENSEKVEDVYIIGKYQRINSHILFIKGSFYPENHFELNDLLQEIIKNGIEIIGEIKGYFCGIYYNIEKKELYFFTDKFGHFDLFFYFKDNLLIISDFFNEILLSKNFSLSDVEVESIYEFILFEFPLFEKTFIKFIKFVSMGTIYKFDLNSNSLIKNQYYDYKFNITMSFNINNIIFQLDRLFNNAFKRIKRMNPSDSVYGLGLSGGMDSRLVAYYAIKYKLKIKTFIYGETNSDAYYISRKLVKLLGLEHYELGFNRDFFNSSEKSINYNPMMNVLYTWYYAIFEKLPEFDILLSGYIGDYQFGMYLDKWDKFIKNNTEFVENILKCHIEIGNIDDIACYFNKSSIISDIKKKIIHFSNISKNSEFWQKKEEFNYKYRQRIFWKNLPSFNFLGLYNQISIFTDLDLFDFLMQIPFELRLKRSLFYSFLKAKLPELLKIRPERRIPVYYRNFLIKFFYRIIRYFDKKLKTHIIFKKSYKEIRGWLSGYEPFINYINNLFSKDNPLFYKLFNPIKIKKLISKSKWNSIEIQLIFRFMTIKLFLDKIIFNLKY